MLTLEKTLKENRQAIHFPGLNAFRFFAASLVVLVHAQGARKELGNFNLDLGISDQMGGLSVTFFFVLSGFLITFLLLKEKENYTSISVKNFYWRRVLRIWPLYYLIIFTAFILLNNNRLFSSIADVTVYQKAPANILLYLTLLPNIAWIVGLQIIYANQLWSVGVEEQFYLFWPLVVKNLSPNRILYFMVGLIASFIVVRNGAAFLGHKQINIIPLSAIAFINSYLTVTRISCMAIGGIGAYYYYFKPDLVTRLISSTVVDILVAALILLLGIKNVYIPYIMYEAYSILFCYVILSASCKANSVLKLENAVWRWLGNLSYGIYMWHMVVLALVLFIIKKLAINSAWQLNCLLYVGILLLTIITSYLSYSYIEKPFLRLKERFAVIKSKA